jgi:histidyl-tRNA synthetase
MTSVLPPRLPRGMRDILPEKMILRQYVEGVIREVFESFGFEPLSTPAVELAETLMGKYGPEAEKLIYDVKHREGKEELALRYDLSVPLARVAAMYPELPRPFKRYQIAPVWRAERPQKGRFREFWQCDVDTVGTESILADAEILNVIYVILRRLGFHRSVIRINNRKILEGIGRFVGLEGELLTGLYRSIDKLDKIGLEGVNDELHHNHIPQTQIDRMMELLGIQGDRSAILAELRQQLSSDSEAVQGIREVERIIEVLEDAGVPAANYRVDFAMVRGLEYYTGPIFETVVEEPKIGSITGGGRYDGLVGVFSKQSLPATGTTIGIERIIVVMEELGMYPPQLGKTVSQVLMSVFDEHTLSDSLRLASELRAMGLKVEQYLGAKGIGDQIRYALKRGIPFVAIIGPEEIAAGCVILRRLDQNTQYPVPRERAAQHITDWLAGN